MSNWRLHLTMQWNMMNSGNGWYELFISILNKWWDKLLCFHYGLFSCFRFVNDFMVVETWWWFKIVHKYVFLGVDYCMPMCRCLSFVEIQSKWYVWKCDNGLVVFLQKCASSIFICCYWTIMTPSMKIQISSCVMCYPIYHPWWIM
jgi:hypothetical protein